MKSIASTLIHEFGIRGAHKYALRIAAANARDRRKFRRAVRKIESGER